MVVTLREDSSIKIPAIIVAKLNLQEGELFDCSAQDESIILKRIDAVPKLRDKLELTSKELVREEYSREHTKKKYCKVSDFLPRTVFYVL